MLQQCTPTKTERMLCQRPERIELRALCVTCTGWYRFVGRRSLFSGRGSSSLYPCYISVYDYFLLSLPTTFRSIEFFAERR